MKKLILAAAAVALSGGAAAQDDWSTYDWSSYDRPADWQGDWWNCEDGEGAILRNAETNIGGFFADSLDGVMAVDLIFTNGEPYRDGDVFAWKKEGDMGIMIRGNGLTDVYVASTTNSPGAVMQITCVEQK